MQLPLHLSGGGASTMRSASENSLLEESSPGVKRTQWKPLTMRAAGPLKSRLCVLHPQADHAQTVCIPTRDKAWAGRNTLSVLWTTFTLLRFIRCLSLLEQIFLFPIFDSNRLTEHIRLTHTESFAEWQKAGAGCTSRAFKHPGHDVTRTWRLAVNFDWLHIWLRAGHRWWRSP